MKNKDIRTLGYVLRRTNYGEADRILNIITPSGKVTAIAKSVRKEKSKLAGGIEMFSLVDLNLHRGKSEFLLVTSAKMVEYFSEIIKNYEKMEFAATVLKDISRLSESSDDREYFEILDQTLRALNGDYNLILIEIWFKLNLLRVSGEEINLYRDNKGEKLEVGERYFWDYQEKCLVKNSNGDISSNEIKIMRLILNNRFFAICKIKNIGEYISPIFRIAKSF